MNWRDRKVFVTGATGFLGGRLVDHLTRLGANVTGLMRTESYCRQRGYNSCHPKYWVRGDVRNQKLMEEVLGEHEIETVFHLAAQTQVGVANDNPVSTFDTNVQGTVSVLEACRRSPRVKQVVMASSDKAYGEGLDKGENAVANPQHAYDVSKMCADMIAQTYARTWGLPVAITRCANLFGGGDLNWSRLIPGTIRSVLRNERPVLRGSGKEVRDWLHVSDAVAAYVRLAEYLEQQELDLATPNQIRELRGRKPFIPDPAVFNFSLGVQVSSLAVVSDICQAAGKCDDSGKVLPSFVPQVMNSTTGEISNQGLDCSKARKLLGWEPKVSLVDGLKEAVEWYKKYV